MKNFHFSPVHFTVFTDNIATKVSTKGQTCQRAKYHQIKVKLGFPQKHNASGLMILEAMKSRELIGLGQSSTKIVQEY